jgi:hypothetical protein
MRRYFRPLFIVGVGLLFLSMLLEWYVFQVFDADHNLIAYWSYNPLFGWNTIFSKDASLNNAFRPSELALPYVLNIIYMISLAGALISLVFKDLETTERKIEKYYPYLILIVLTLCLNLFYIALFPILFLLPNEFYFPFLVITDKDADLTYSYTIAPGYILQILGFLLIFPYAIFYFLTFYRFQSPAPTMEDIINNYIEKVIEKPDLDELIAKEEVKLKTFPSAKIEPKDVTVLPIVNQKTRRR